METETKQLTQGKIDDNRNKPMKKVIFDAAVKKNAILASGMVIAPLVVYADTFKHALTLVISFSMITLITLIVSMIIPNKMVYTIRIILHTLIGAVAFIPTAMILDSVMPDEISSMGVYFPLLITNSMIISRSDDSQLHLDRKKMIADTLFGVIGYDVAALLFGTMREIISFGEFNGNIIAMPAIVNGFAYPYGGFILLGIFAALLRGIFLLVRRFKS